MESLEAKAIINALNRQHTELSNIAKALGRLVQIASATLTAEQRRDLKDTDLARDAEMKELFKKRLRQEVIEDK